MKRSLLLISACACFVFAAGKLISSNQYVEAKNVLTSTMITSDREVSETQTHDANSATVSIDNMSAEEIYGRFGYLTDEQIENYYPGLDDTDKVVAPTGGGIIHSDSDTSSVALEKLSEDDSTKNVLAEINPNTDPNAITYRKLKDFLKEHQEEMYEIFQNE